MASSFSKTKFNNAISRFSMLRDGAFVLVGFSGGADSTLLLSLLSQTDGITVAAAHINHGIRGEDAFNDEYFCRRFCKENNITLYVKRADVPSEAKRLGLGIEEAARKIRYEFFDEICREYGYDLIATAHNADDNLETVIFNLTRGAGIDGLSGIPPVRGNIIRPLILYSKDEVLNGCKELQIPYVTDSTNADNTYSRNLIRNTVIPQLKKINPSLCDTVNGMSALLKADCNYLKSLSDEHSFSDGRSKLRELDDSILSRIIISEMKSKDIVVERDHVNEIISAIRSDAPRSEISVNGATFLCDRELVYFTNSAENIGFCIPVSFGLNVIDDRSAFGLYQNSDQAEEDINKLKNIYKLSIQAKINSDKIFDNTILRNRKDGDKYRLNGMTKKVKKLIQSLKLPRQIADRIPFLVSGNEILYIPFFKPSDNCSQQNNDTFTAVYYTNYDIK